MPITIHYLINPLYPLDIYVYRLPYHKSCMYVSIHGSFFPLIQEVPVQVASLQSEELRSYILAGCQVLFSTTTVAGAASKELNCAAFEVG